MTNYPRDTVTRHPVMPDQNNGIEGGGDCCHRFRAPDTIDAHRRNVQGLDRHLGVVRSGTDTSEPIDWTHTALSWEQREWTGRAA